MAPLSEETTVWTVQSEDPAFDEVQPMKPVFEDTTETSDETDPLEEDILPEPLVDSTNDFCTNLFGSLLGNTKVCEHCKQKILNSEERIKEKERGSKIYFHSNCKEERTKMEENKKAVLQDLLNYFIFKEDMQRMFADELRNMPALADTKSRDDEPSRGTQRGKSTKKRGFFSRFFGGCRSNESVQV